MRSLLDVRLQREAEAKRIEALALLSAEGLSMGEMGRRMGGISRQAVFLQLKQAGLSKAHKKARHEVTRRNLPRRFRYSGLGRVTTELFTQAETVGLKVDWKAREIEGVPVIIHNSRSTGQRGIKLWYSDPKALNIVAYGSPLQWLFLMPRLRGPSRPRITLSRLMLPEYATWPTRNEIRDAWEHVLTPHSRRAIL